MQSKHLKAVQAKDCGGDEGRGGVHFLPLAVFLPFSGDFFVFFALVFGCSGNTNPYSRGSIPLESQSISQWISCFFFLRLADSTISAFLFIAARCCSDVTMYLGCNGPVPGGRSRKLAELKAAVRTIGAKAGVTEAVAAVGGAVALGTSGEDSSDTDPQSCLLRFRGRRRTG